MSSVPTEDRLGELLLRWDELRRRGRDPSAGELCGDCPELADELRRRIDVIRGMDPVLDIGTTQIVATPEDGSPGGLVHKPADAFQFVERGGKLASFTSTEAS